MQHYRPAASSATRRQKTLSSARAVTRCCRGWQVPACVARPPWQMRHTGTWSVAHASSHRHHSHAHVLRSNTRFQSIQRSSLSSSIVISTMFLFSPLRYSRFCNANSTVSMHWYRCHCIVGATHCADSTRHTSCANHWRVQAVCRSSEMSAASKRPSARPG